MSALPAGSSSSSDHIEGIVFWRERDSDYSKSRKSHEKKEGPLLSGFSGFPVLKNVFESLFPVFYIKRKEFHENFQFFEHKEYLTF